MQSMTGTVDAEAEAGRTSADSTAPSGAASLNLVPTFQWLRGEALTLAAQPVPVADSARESTTTDLLLLVCALEQVLADHIGRGTLDLAAVTRRHDAGPA